MPENCRSIFAVESLECRRLLAAIHPARAHNPIPPTFAALGDSFSYEYQFMEKFPSNAYNFVEQLSMANIAYFGPYSSSEGYAYDWGIPGATSSNMAEEVAGIMPAVKAGKIQYVTLLLGGNDFEDALIGRHVDATLRSLPSTVWSNLLAGITQLQAADPNLKIAVSTLEQLEGTPDKIADVSDGVFSEESLQLADTEQDVVNADIIRLARHDSNVCYVNFEAQLESIEAQPTYDFDGVTLQTMGTGSDPHDLWFRDGEHIGTIEQGLWANLIVDSINEKFGTTFADLTDAQILGLVGL